MSMEAFMASLSDEQKQQLLGLLATATTTTPAPKKPRKPRTKKAKPEPASSIPLAPLAVPPPEPQRREDDFTIPGRSKVKGNKQAVKAGQNTWVDDGTEAKDVVTPMVERAPRVRQPPKKVQLVCHLCQRKFEELEENVYGEFPRCTRCASKSGR